MPRARLTPSSHDLLLATKEDHGMRDRLNHRHAMTGILCAGPVAVVIGITVMPITRFSESVCTASPLLTGAQESP
jgi:hypothetical protein